MSEGQRLTEETCPNNCGPCLFGGSTAQISAKVWMQRCHLPTEQDWKTYNLVATFNMIP